MNNVNKTLYIPLYGKAYVSRKGIILSDRWAEEIWEAEGFKLKGKSKSKWLAYFMGMRAKVFDEWAKDNLQKFADSIVLHLGCGLDSRVERIGEFDNVWFDVDFPSVIDERLKYYNQSEKYVLTLSHDEVVHLKCSLLNKMPGYEVDKFKNLMCAYAFMMGHSGKKLLFMGQEFAQAQEWSEARELDWYLLQNPEHKKIQDWMKDLLHIYQKNKAMYELDASWEGFEWINADDRDRSIFSFVRKSKDGKNNLLFVINFTPMAREDYRVGVPRGKQYKLILNSHDVKFGGNDIVENRETVYKAAKGECDRQPFSFSYPLPPYGVAVFEF
jgi:hypothetical protein